MQKELLKNIYDNRQEYEKKIIESIKDYRYNYERYESNFTLAIGAICSDINMESFAQLIRETDKFIVLDKRICCMVFPFSDASQGLKAASNLLSEFEAKFFSKKIYIAVENAGESSSSEKQVERLFDILKNSIENGMQNMPMDSTGSVYL